MSYDELRVVGVVLGYCAPYSNSYHRIAEGCHTNCWCQLLSMLYPLALPAYREVGLFAADYRHGPGWVGLYQDHARQIVDAESIHEKVRVRGAGWFGG